LKTYKSKLRRLKVPVKTLRYSGTIAIVNKKGGNYRDGFKDVMHAMAVLSILVPKHYFEKSFST
jgi:hypothetical protein